MKASYLIQYLCLFSIEVPTKEGDVFVFVASDMYSQFLFMTGVEKDRGKENVLKHVKLLIKHKDFKKHLPKPFTLIFHKYEELRQDITKLIAPLGGSMIVDDLCVTKQMAPVMEHLYKSFSNSIR